MMLASVDRIVIPSRQASADIAFYGNVARDKTRTGGEPEGFVLASASVAMQQFSIVSNRPARGLGESASAYP